VKPVMLVGIVLIILGVLALAYQGITYTTREKVVDLGLLTASIDAAEAAEHHASLEARFPEPWRYARACSSREQNGDFRCYY
jgi:hypothetical protein